METAKSSANPPFISPETLEMMKLAETGFSEWNDPEEDIYSILTPDPTMDNSRIDDSQALIAEAHREYKMGKTQQVTVDELMASLNDPEEDIEYPEFTSNPQSTMDNSRIDDSDALIVKAFLAALSQQDTIPEGLPNDLRKIAQNLSQNLEKLYTIATKIPEFATEYHRAYDLLNTASAERGMGLDFTPDDSSVPTLSTTIDNSVPDPSQRPKMTEVLAKLEQFDNETLAKKTWAVFTASDPAEELKNAFNFGQIGF
ncbi:hypothetical protein [Spirulina sp. 06S082]|uniref:hypothetical protein n=1 Tax=Spirulina sp. 06S082 TaxID=3110248 RepID=UPI002B2072C3|nr:hypothetical protein [Spirulina sp. 06S082]